MGPRATQPRTGAASLTPSALASAPHRKWRSWAVTGALWTLVLGGAVAGILGLARSGQAASIAAPSVVAEPLIAPSEVLGTAEWAVSVALLATETPAVEAVIVDPASRPRIAGSSVEVLGAVAIRAEPLSDGYWAVTVATDVRSATGVALRWYLEVGVVETPGGPVATTDPALVPAPAPVTGAVELAGQGPGRPDQTDPVVQTVGSFLTALVTGDPTVNRWTAPGVDIWPAASEGTFVKAELTEIAVSRDGAAATARAEIAVEMADESIAVFAYSLDLAEREGRWEVIRVGGAPPIGRIADRPPAVLSEPAASSASPMPPTSAADASVTSPTTNP